MEAFREFADQVHPDVLRKWELQQESRVARFGPSTKAPSRPLATVVSRDSQRVFTAFTKEEHDAFARRRREILATGKPGPPWDPDSECKRIVRLAKRRLAKIRWQERARLRRREAGLSAQRKLILEHKRASGGCHCGESHPAALQFHHRNPAEKSFGISSGATKSLEDLSAELAKCDVLCASCHAKLHWQLAHPDDIDGYGALKAS